MTPTEQDKGLRGKVAAIIEYWDFSPLQDEDSRIERLKSEIMQLITAYTNKQVEEVLDRIADAWSSSERLKHTNVTIGEEVFIDAIEAERNKLNPSKSTPLEED